MLEVLTTDGCVVILSNMKAILLLRERHVLSERAFVEVLVWRVPKPVPGSAHDFKYSLALVADGNCVLRYDNETGKGDHKHLEGRESRYEFVDLSRMQTDFCNDVERWETDQ